MVKSKLMFNFIFHMIWWCSGFYGKKQHFLLNCVQNICWFKCVCPLRKGDDFTSIQQHQQHQQRANTKLLYSKMNEHISHKDRQTHTLAKTSANSVMLLHARQDWRVKFMLQQSWWWCWWCDETGKYGTRFWTSFGWKLFHVQIFANQTDCASSVFFLILFYLIFARLFCCWFYKHLESKTWSSTLFHIWV